MPFGVAAVHQHTSRVKSTKFRSQWCFQFHYMTSIDLDRLCSYLQRVIYHVVLKGRSMGDPFQRWRSSSATKERRLESALNLFDPGGKYFKFKSVSSSNDWKTDGMSGNRRRNGAICPHHPAGDRSAGESCSACPLTPPRAGAGPAQAAAPRSAPRRWAPRPPAPARSPGRSVPACPR